MITSALPLSLEVVSKPSTEAQRTQRPVAFPLPFEDRCQRKNNSSRMAAKKLWVVGD